ncbi:hypothetical protein AB0B50_40220 [Streptomyces sp. NPDC041068]|uniref:hypothetical protein n=1 Tax=Streptomyces sp. NPDC041068 TaxID=3155130 RepID=UPI0033E0360F
MRLTDDDRQMAVRDFFMPAQLLEFADLPDGAARIAWGEGQFARRKGHTAVRRLEGEPDAGSMCTWTRAPGGFRYEIDTRRGVRAGEFTWREVHQVIESRLTAVRYGALRKAVEEHARHEEAYTPCPGPYADPAAWDRGFYRDWSRGSSALQLKAAAALDAILPAAVAHPALF